MKHLIISALCLMTMLSIPSVVDAQSDETSPAFSPKVIVKYSVLNILDPETAVQLAAEYLFKPKMGFQQQLGYIFKNPAYADYEFTRGIRARSEMRFYYGKKRRMKSYVAPEVMYKFVQQYGIRDFSREGGAYQQTIDFRANRNVIGFIPKIGLTNNIFERKFAVDFAFGIGVKAVYYNSNVPSDVFDEDFFISDTFFNLGLRNSGHEVLPNLYFGLLLGFVAK